MLTQEGYPYKFDQTKCSTCEGNCCIGESGYIWITYKEIENLANHLGKPLEFVTANYIFKANYKYSIKEKQIGPNSFACVFFDTLKKQCSIYEARPSQCRTFPFWEHFKNNPQEVKKECPAIVD
ncbi:MAG: YkgJ family cysteine cluster protein [Campylobacterales bacterium]|nr:YkgJ family cysteine cluster protein [Campylobacterales bacterium]